jgi:hypothetical protein
MIPQFFNFHTGLLLNCGELYQEGNLIRLAIKTNDDLFRGMQNERKLYYQRFSADNDPSTPLHVTLGSFDKIETQNLKSIIARFKSGRTFLVKASHYIKNNESSPWEVYK